MKKNANRKSKKILITPAEYARRRGLNKSTVYRQIADKKIPTVGDLVDVAAADVARKKNVNLRKKTVATMHPSTPANAPDVQPDAQPDDASKLELEKRLIRERVEKLRLENEISAGKYVLVDDVRRAQAERAMVERDALLNFPGRVAANMAAKLSIPERDLFILLDVEIRRFLTERSQTAVPA